MYAGFNFFLHMDDDWMHRVYLEDSRGKIVGRSRTAYFRREDAKRALATLMYSAIMHADAA